VHVGARRDERIGEHAGQFANAGEVRQDADAAEVVVLHDQVTARGDGVPEPGERLDPLRQVEQQQPGIDQIKRPARDCRGLAEVVLAERALAVAIAVQDLDRQRAERCIGVDAEYPAGGPDPFGHRAHGLAGPAAGVQAGRPWCEAGLVEEPPCRGVPHPGLRPQPVVFLRRMPQRVRAAPLLGLGNAHMSRLLPPRGSRPLMPRVLSRGIL